MGWGGWRLYLRGRPMSAAECGACGKSGVGRVSKYEEEGATRLVRKAMRGADAENGGVAAAGTDWGSPSKGGCRPEGERGATRSQG